MSTAAANESFPGRKKNEVIRSAAGKRMQTPSRGYSILSKKDAGPLYGTYGKKLKWFPAELGALFMPVDEREYVERRLSFRD